MSGYRLTPDELAAQVKDLATLGERTSGLVSSAGQLAQRLPKLGTAPPALHLAAQLRQAAGETGLTRDVTAADTGLNTAHTALRESVAQYLHAEERITDALKATEGGLG
ncbi:MAG TPA: hypothetical protein VGM75_11200 [Pseudonocardiaceae bacterium]|jgi:hypothetical protein